MIKNALKCERCGGECGKRRKRCNHCKRKCCGICARTEGGCWGDSEQFSRCFDAPACVGRDKQPDAYVSRPQQTREELVRLFGYDPMKGGKP